MEKSRFWLEPSGTEFACKISPNHVPNPIWLAITHVYLDDICWYCVQMTWYTVHLYVYIILCRMHMQRLQLCIFYSIVCIHICRQWFDTQYVLSKTPPNTRLCFIQAPWIDQFPRQNRPYATQHPGLVADAHAVGRCIDTPGRQEGKVMAFEPFSSKSSSSSWFRWFRFRVTVEVSRVLGVSPQIPKQNYDYVRSMRLNPKANYYSTL